MRQCDRVVVEDSSAKKTSFVLFLFLFLLYFVFTWMVVAVAFDF